MAKKITKLTAEQEAQLVTWRDEWRAIGTRTGHDDACAELGRAAVVDAYKEIGVDAPALVLWAQSPLQALLMYWALRSMLEHKASEGKTPEGGQLRDQLWGQLREAWNQWWCWGQCESYWTAYYRFAISIGVKVTDEQDRRLAIWERLARSAFMVFSWRGVAILVQHPSVAKFDGAEPPRLHCSDGPALAWPDGYAVYAVHGIRLSPERGEAMASGKLTAQQIRDEPNAEVRRVLVGAFNAGDSGRYLRELGAEVIHSDTDALGLPRRLLRIEQAGDEPYVAIEVTNSTPEPDGHRKLYTFRCHPELRPLPVRGVRTELGGPQPMTCQNAIASTYGYTGEDFLLAVQT